MEKQLIIAVSREYGTSGHNVALALAEEFHLPLYNRNMLDEIAAHKDVDVEKLHKYDERPRNVLISRTVRGMSNSPEEVIAQFQFDYLKKKAESGESFVVVGRCAEYILREFPGLVTIFILGDKEDKVRLVMEKRGVTEKEALSIMTRHDKKRKAYHNYHCPNKWGDARGYDITMNISRLGLEQTAKLLVDYVRMRTGTAE